MPGRVANLETELTEVAGDCKHATMIGEWSVNRRIAFWRIWESSTASCAESSSWPRTRFASCSPRRHRFSKRRAGEGLTGSRSSKTPARSNWITRRSLSEGEYLASIDYSRSAEFHAKRAIDIARSQVRQKKQEIARIAAAARRRRQSSILAVFQRQLIWQLHAVRPGRVARGAPAVQVQAASGGSGFSRSGW